MEGGGVVKDERRLVASPFLVKTYRLVDDSSTDHIVSWGKHNNTLVVWRPRELSASVLPRYFSHTNFSSFVRQLNTYGFRKVVRGRCEFGNELFRKGQKHLLSHIQRRKPSISLPPQTMELAWQTGYHQSLIPNSASRVQDSDVPPAAPCLSEENEILKRNNLLLLSEIECLQNICVRNFELFIRHKTRDPALIDRKIDEVSSSVSLTNVADENSRSPPKLFGVPLR